MFITLSAIILATKIAVVTYGIGAAFVSAACLKATNDILKNPKEVFNNCKSSGFSKDNRTKWQTKVSQESYQDLQR